MSKLRIHKPLRTRRTPGEARRQNIKRMRKAIRMDASLYSDETRVIRLATPAETRIVT